jgi:hypothetical protein
LGQGLGAVHRVGADDREAARDARVWEGTGERFSVGRSFIDEKWRSRGIRREAKSVWARSTGLAGGSRERCRGLGMHDAGGGTHSASTASSVVSPSAPGPPSRRCGRVGEEGGYVSGEICCFLTSRGWRWREARWTPGMRVLDRGRYVARAHLCAALTRTVADSFLPLRRVDAVAAISSRFIPRQYFSLFASPLTPWAGAPTRGSSLPLARPRPFASS